MKILTLLLLAILFTLGSACSKSEEGGVTSGEISAPGDAAIDGALQDMGPLDTALDANEDSAKEDQSDGAQEVSADAPAEVTADLDGETSDGEVAGDADDTGAATSDGGVPGDADAAGGETEPTDAGSPEDSGLDVPESVDADAAETAPDAALEEVSLDVVEDVAPQPNFGEILTLSEGSGAELYAMAVLESGLVVVLWRSGDQDVMLTAIDPLTNTISAPLIIEADAGEAQITRGGDVVAMGEHLALVWWSEIPGDTPEDDPKQVIRFKTGALDSMPAGSSILDTASSGNLWRPHLVHQTPGNLCALWQRDKDVKLMCSDDQGMTFGDMVGVDPTGAVATLSGASFLNTGELVVGYQATGSTQPSIFVRKSADMGVTWSVPIDVGSLSSVGQALQPTMAPGTAGQIHLAWYNSYQGVTSAWHTVSTDGVSWSAPVELPTVKSWVALKPGRGESLHISGQDAMPGYGTTHYMSSEDNGQTWGAATPIPVTPGATSPIEFNAELEANLLEGWLHLAWWEGSITDQSLRFVTVLP